jgi:type IV pilus assembly protein PilF
MSARRVVAVLAAALVAGCAGQNQGGGQRGDNQNRGNDPDGPLLVQEPGDARTRAKAHTDLAAAYFELGNMGVALEEVRIALSADPNYAPAYNVQALVNMDLRDTAAAEASFKRALALAPQDPDVNHNYGFFLCQTGRQKEGLQQLMAAVRSPMYQNPSKSWGAAGRCVMDSNPQEAAQYFDRALRLDPNNVNALLPYAELQYRRGGLTEAKAAVVRYNKLVEPTAESLWLGVRIERKLGDRLAENQYATQLRRRYSASKEYQDMLRGKFD